MTDAPVANREQATLWNDRAGNTWVELQELIDGLFRPFEARVVEAAFPGEGRRVVDIGCGTGATTRAMARRLGPGGECLGIDISQPLVDGAREASADVRCAKFIAADAQTHAFEAASFDAAISRFGVMFFDDPVAAFANIRRSLRPGGKLAFACWRSPAENPFMTAAAGAAAPLLPGLPSASPDSPGQFAFASAERVRNILAAAGWSDIEIRMADAGATLTPQELAVYAIRMGPVGVALQGLDEGSSAAVRELVLRAFDPFLHDGVARLNLACWLVTARG